MRRTLPGSNQYVTKYAVSTKHKQAAKARHQRRKKQDRNANMKFWLSVYGIFVVVVFMSVTGLRHASSIHAQAANIQKVHDFKPIKVAKKVVPSPLPIPSEPPLHIADNSWEAFKEKVRRIAPIYDFPVNVALSQAALESNRGYSEYAQEKNNFFGIAAYDWNPDDAWSFDNQEQCIIVYMQLIKKNFPEAYAARHNPDVMVQLLENNSAGVVYATDPDYVWKLENLPEWSEE